MIKTQNITLSSTEKIGLVSNFATMLTAGISILEVVDSLLEDAKGNQKKLLQTLREDLSQGNQVYTCFARFPKVFDKVTVNIIKASEEAGTLDVTLRDLKKNIQDEIEFTDKIKAALTYPVMIFLVFIGVLLMILIVVVPKISTVFLRMNVVLPLPTRVMIFVSNALLTYTIPVIAVVIGIIGGIYILYKNNSRFILGILFSLPLVSELVKQIDLTRFSRSLHLLLSSGLPITTALQLSQDVVMRKDIAKIIGHSYDMVLSGKRLSEGLKLSKGKVPTIVVKIVEAGEKTGSLDRSMQDISEYLDYQVTNSLRTITALIEPLMLVGVGVMVGGMMLAIIAPIYSIIGQVGTR